MSFGCNRQGRHNVAARHQDGRGAVSSLLPPRQAACALFSHSWPVPRGRPDGCRGRSRRAGPDRRTTVFPGQGCDDVKCDTMAASPASAGRHETPAMTPRCAKIPRQCRSVEVLKPAGKGPGQVSPRRPGYHGAMLHLRRRPRCANPRRGETSRIAARPVFPRYWRK